MEASHDEPNYQILVIQDKYFRSARRQFTILTSEVRYSFGLLAQFVLCLLILFML